MSSLNDAVEFAENPEPRCPCVLLLDTSGSMNGPALDALNQGLVTFRENLIQDSLAQMRVEVAVVTFDSQVRVVCDFVTADNFVPPVLTAQGMTHTGSAIHQALDLIQERKLQYRTNGIAYYRPWVFMITDGQPSGETAEVLERARLRLHQEENEKRVAFFAVGVEGADMNQLGQLVVRAPLKLKGLHFGEMFTWLSVSMQRVSHSRPDEQVSLPPPGWGAI